MGVGGIFNATVVPVAGEGRSTVLRKRWLIPANQSMVCVYLSCYITAILELTGLGKDHPFCSLGSIKR